MMDFEITKQLATISQTNTSAKQLNLVSWNSSAAKLDLRLWRMDGDEVKPCKGLTLSDAEARALYTALGDYLQNV